MKIINGRVYNTALKLFERRAVSFDKGLISEDISGKAYDVKGAYVIPGLVDIHTHGIYGTGFMGSGADRLARMLDYYAAEGTTAVMPTTVSASDREIADAVKNIGAAAKLSETFLCGVHIEGPYINKARAGCHPLDRIRPIFIEDLLKWRKLSGADRMHVTVAPELDGALGFISACMKNRISVSLGHSDATYREATAAFQRGASGVTHLFNAMRPIGHREGGMISAVFDMCRYYNVYSELICDMFHVNPDIVRMARRLCSSDYIVLVSDSIPAARAGDGEYTICGIQITVRDSRAYNPEGKIAGSTITVLEGLRNYIKATGESPENAILTVTKNPASAVGVYDSVGSLDAGKRADALVLDDSFELVEVIRRGKVL